MHVQAALQALDLRGILACRLIHPAEVEALVQIDLELTRLELCLESELAHGLFTAE